MKTASRKEILAQVKSFYRATRDKRFIPGKTPIPYAGRVYDEKELVNLVDASLDFWLTAGRFARKFEMKLAKYVGSKYCLLTNSGSSANLLAVSALTSPLLKERRLRAGDEVITTACGFPTTLNPVVQNGLMPVFVDVDLGTYTMQVDTIEPAITKKTKALFLAHTLGNPAAMDMILKIVKKYGLWLIEDNCDALGSRYRGRYTGTFGHIATCSFYPAHHITMGEGGACLTSDPLLKKILMSFRDWGRDCSCEPGQDNTCGKRFAMKMGGLPYGYDHKYIYSHIGYNLRVTDMQAAIGEAQLAKLPKFTAMRRKNFDYLQAHLRKYADSFILPEATAHAEPSWFGFPLMVRSDAPFTRADIVAYLEKNKIATRMLFGGNLIKQPAYEGISYRVAGTLKCTDMVMDDLFWLGVYPGLSKAHLSYIAGVFDRFMALSAQY